MRHKEAWRRLPDLLDDRDDAVLLAHVRECSACQRQLFLLGRVDRLLRDRASAQRSARKRPPARMLAAAVAAVAAVAAATLALVLPQQARTHEFMLRTASGSLAVGSYSSPEYSLSKHGARSWTSARRGRRL